MIPIAALFSKNQNFLKLYVWGCPESQSDSSQRTPPYNRYETYKQEIKK